MNDIEKAIEDLRGLSDRSSIKSELFKERHGKNFNLAISALEKQLNGGWIPVSDGKYIIEVKEGEVVSCQNFEI